MLCGIVLFGLCAFGKIEPVAHDGGPCNVRMLSLALLPRRGRRRLTSDVDDSSWWYCRCRVRHGKLPSR